MAQYSTLRHQTHSTLCDTAQLSTALLRTHRQVGERERTLSRFPRWNSFFQMFSRGCLPMTHFFGYLHVFRERKKRFTFLLRQRRPFFPRSATSCYWIPVLLLDANGWPLTDKLKSFTKLFRAMQLTVVEFHVLHCDDSFFFQG